MGNTHVKPHPRTRNKKQVHWKAAARPFPPGKPQLVSETDVTPDLVTIRWGKPPNDGGSPISGYLVEHRRTGSPHWVRATPILVQVPEITISGLEPGWRYQFRISAENAVGLSDPSELSEPITVTLQRSAVTAPRFTQELEDKIALDNEKSEFVVHFLGQPAPKVCWFKDGFEIFSSRRIRILTESDRSVLTIHQCALSDEGEIKCTATNRAGHVSTKAALAIEAPPSIRLPRQYEEGLLFEIGEMIRLKVSVAGRPTPLVFWSHNGESIKNNDRYEVEYIDKCSVLKVNEAQRHDRGEYQIKAVNKLGEDTQSFLVTVTDKPSPPGRARVIMALGKSVTLSWGTPRDDGGCKIGNYIVEYYRLGWNVWLKAATSRQLTTILGDLIEGSEYKFRVKAESPYGVSDPSEESDVVFIPDAKRGILQPAIRGRSQPRETNQETASPVVARRKNKHRSQSSSRVEDNYSVKNNIENAGIPKRPERTKIKSPPKTPDLSAHSNRKVVNSKMEQNIFEPSDRSSMARDLAYGSPDIKLRREVIKAPNLANNYYSSSSEKSRTPSPSKDVHLNHQTYTVKIDSTKPSSPAKVQRSPSPELQSTRSPRDNNENFTGSSEFMLVLYPDENEQDHSDFDFDDISIPPPMSLSAPELGAEPPLFHNLRHSASSTELLHERAMMRFYQAAEAEEAELEKRRNAVENRNQIVDIPKILINSKDDQDIVGLQRQHSFRRMSAGSISHKQALLAQRRHSLRNSSELKSDMIQPNLHKFPIYPELKRETMMNRQRSESEEREELAFQDVRKRMSLQGQSSFEKRKISIVDEEKWAEDYVSSTEDSESSDDDILIRSKEKFVQERIRRISYEDDDEADTYHPGSVTSEPFEILTKRKKPPDPSFIPKPILKKKEHEEYLNQDTISPQSKQKIRSHSPMPLDINQRGRSQSLVDEGLDIQSIKNKFQPKVNEKSRPRSFSLIPQKDLLSKHSDVSDKLLSLEKSERVAPGHNISAVAQISGITAASIVIPEKLLEKQKNAEEAKVLIDHYGDIVKNYGKRNKSNPKLHLDKDALKKYAPDIETPETDFEVLNKFRNDIDEYPKDNTKNSIGNSINHDNYNRRTDPSANKPRRDSLITGHTYHDNNNIRTNTTDLSAGSPRRDSLTATGESCSTRTRSPLRKKRERTLSKSPPKQFNKDSSPRRSPSKSRLSISPVRPENWSTLKSPSDKPKRKTTPSPMRRKSSSSPIRRKTSPSPMSRKAVNSRAESKSPSPILPAKYKPMLREIMTQTSIGLDTFDSDSNSRTSSPSGRSQKHEDLIAQAEVKVRSMIDYITDLAMFFVACWLYLFKNELLAIPVLLIMVYRQLQVEIASRIPKWILRRIKKKKK